MSVLTCKLGPEITSLRCCTAVLARLISSSSLSNDINSGGNSCAGSLEGTLGCSLKDFVSLVSFFSFGGDEENGLNVVFCFNGELRGVVLGVWWPKGLSFQSRERPNGSVEVGGMDEAFVSESVRPAESTCVFSW